MSVSKVRLVVLGLAAAGLVTAGWAAGLGGDLGGFRLAAAGPAAANAGEKGTGAAAGEDSAGRVDAPGTEVNVDKERGRVSVAAPYTDVKVDPDKGRVRVHAPYVDLDVRW